MTEKLKIINEPVDGKCGYMSFYRSHQVGVYADTTLDAKKLVAAHFKVPPKQQWLISVHIVSVGSREIVHTPTE